MSQHKTRRVCAAVQGPAVPIHTNQGEIHFLFPASSCLCVRLHICLFHLAHEEQTPPSSLRASAPQGGWIWGAEKWGFGPALVVGGSCLSCALKAVFAPTVISKVPVALLPYALRLCCELACTQQDKTGYENGAEGDTGKKICRRRGESSAGSSSEGHV